MRKVCLPIFLCAAVHLAAQKKDTVRARDIEEVVFQRTTKINTSDVGNTTVDARQAATVVSASGGIEGLLKTLPSVNSNTELSSQYMVRGGSYDENLIYINDIEIYRPFLIRNSQQEGLSVINPDMVAAVNFSAGGFEAKYGDKMSSALNIYYREPSKPELLGEASLIGGRLPGGWANKNKKLTALVSGRYRNTALLFKSLREKTDFTPQYIDGQAFLNYHLSPKVTISALGFFGKNDYEMVPRTKEVEFGTVNQPIKMSIFYNGREDDGYINMLGALSVVYRPTERWRVTLDNFYYRNREREYFSIASAYAIQPFDIETGQPATSYETGGQIDHARNDLMMSSVGSQLRARYALNVNANVEVGAKVEVESLHDHTNEWRLVDSLGYSTPRPQTIPGVLDGSPLELYYHIGGENKVTPRRISAYAQYAQKFLWGSTKMYANAGVRVSNWSFNQETIVSPRFQLSAKPDWRSDMLFRLAGGVYYQQPYYKEIKDLAGTFNADIRSQRSYQLVLGNDYEFQMYRRPFKLTTELYYKKMDRLIPFYMDNVRVRYSGKNNAEGHAYGVDARLFGEFVPGVDSWLSLSYARTYENIDQRGDIPRATDQRLRFAVFYQDYMPRFPKMRVNITGIYAKGLPTGAPILTDPYQYQSVLPDYKRVDIGLSYAFVDPKDKKKNWGFFGRFEELSLGVQVFNAFNIYNTVANQWITDVTSSTQRVYAVPVNLTGRFFNAILQFRLR